jgi:hypothetical protein
MIWMLLRLVDQNSAPRPAAVSHGEDGEPLLDERGIGLGESLGELHARLPPAAHDGDDASTVGACRDVHVERERQAVLVPVHHIRRHRGLTRGCRGIADSDADAEQAHATRARSATDERKRVPIRIL